MGIPPLEDRLFVSLLIFSHLQAFCGHRMHAFGVAMRSVATESSLGLLGSPINRGPNNRMFTFSDRPLIP